MVAEMAKRTKPGHQLVDSGVHVFDTGVGVVLDH